MLPRFMQPGDTLGQSRGKSARGDDLCVDVSLDDTLSERKKQKKAGGSSHNWAGCVKPFMRVPCWCGLHHWGWFDCAHAWSLGVSRVQKAS